MAGAVMAFRFYIENLIEWGVCRCSRHPSPLRIRETGLRFKRIAKPNIALEDLKREPAPKNDQTFRYMYREGRAR